MFLLSFSTFVSRLFIRILIMKYNICMYRRLMLYLSDCTSFHWYWMHLLFLVAIVWLYFNNLTICKTFILLSHHEPHNVDIWTVVEQDKTWVLITLWHWHCRHLTFVKWCWAATIFSSFDVILHLTNFQSADWQVS